MITLDQVKAIVLSGDPAAKHYFQTARGNYTTWHEFKLLPETADDLHDGGWNFQIDRFTKLEGDSVVDDIRDALDVRDNVAYSYTVDFEQDTGYIHHIFSCEVI